MKAARFYNNSDVRIDEVPEPSVEPHQIGIDIAWCGICGSDMIEFTDGPIIAPGPDIPHPITGETAPITIGHEMSGVVYAVGEGVTDFKIGDHVVVEPIILPESVPTGPDDTYNVHPEITWFGFAGRGGGLSEKFVVNERWAHKIDHSIPLDEAALIEPLSVAYHAIKRSGVKSGDTVLVTGAGPIGLMTTLMLSKLNVRTIVSEPIPLRRKMALEHAKADYVLDPDFEDITEVVFELTDGKGVPVGFECSANQNALDNQVASLAPKGTLYILSLWNNRVSFDVNHLVIKELEIIGSMIYNNDHEPVIKMVENGEFDLRPFITHHIGLDDLIPVGYNMLINDKGSAVKVVVSPTGKGLKE